MSSAYKIFYKNGLFSLCSEGDDLHNTVFEIFSGFRNVVPENIPENGTEFRWKPYYNELVEVTLEKW